ncbi:hypothetical protein AXF42_Ash013591 [Apostasia shenzhenica]|uniref:Helitron helicase-like domain-containing protein n=1 Tax=Apostasia shenzhenica TaxID=1088818 RepID=A0A2I0APD5_9ASPA|nr:hypothetical protein AXF42_Ash013591 [Apostasia shenzhenica]
MIGDPLQNINKRDVIIYNNQKGFKRISEAHPAYMPLQYPLLFPYGEDGWHIYLNKNISNNNAKYKKITMKDFYAFRLQQRHEEGTTLLRSGRLFQQFCVDAFASVE